MEQTAIEKTATWKRNALIIGAVLGAITGAGTAYMLTQRATNDGTPPTFTSGEGLKLSLLLLGLVRQVVQLFE